MTVFIAYKGGASGGTRTITAEQWAEQGVPDFKTTVWDESNGWTLDVSEWPEAAIHLAALQREFDLIESDEPVIVVQDIEGETFVDETALSLGLDDLPQTQQSQSEGDLT